MKARLWIGRNQGNHNLTPQERFWEKVNKKGPRDCWMWKASIVGNGYAGFSLNGRIRRAHRIIWQWTFGNIPGGKHVLHKCDNRLCVNPNHLFLGTHTDNMHDMMEKGRYTNLVGEQHGMAKLTKIQVLKIRKLASTGSYTYAKLSQMFGVNPVQISNIVRRKSWNHI